VNLGSCLALWQRDAGQLNLVSLNPALGPETYVYVKIPRRVHVPANARADTITLKMLDDTTQ